MEASYDACTQEARSAKPNVEPNPLFVRGSLADMFGQWVDSNMLLPATQGAALRQCMFRRGYRPIPLTLEETKDLAAQKTPDDMEGWVGRFYRRADFMQRLESTVPPPLSEGSPEPLTYGAIRFDPDRLEAASGMVRPGGALLHGPVRYRRTAVLSADSESTLFRHGLFRAGSQMHEAVFKIEDGPPKSYWCGPYLTGHYTFQACARNDVEGYREFVAEGAGWIATGLDSGAGEVTTTNVIKLQEDGHSDPSLISFLLTLNKTGKESVVLEADVSNGRDGETLWRSHLKFDGSGVAVLPFWTHRLVLTRDGDAVSARFERTGDGAGWP